MEGGAGMSETYLDKLHGRTVDALYCDTCVTFTPASMVPGTAIECPRYRQKRVPCAITVHETRESELDYKKACLQAFVEDRDH